MVLASAGSRHVLSNEATAHLDWSTAGLPELLSRAPHRHGDSFDIRKNHELARTIIRSLPPVPV